jgi:hypothetical protein
MTALLIASHVLVALLFFAGGALVKRQSWKELGMALGREAERQVHGWGAANYLARPDGPKRRLWAVVNRKRPEPPGLVERHIAPTHERAPLPRH